MSCENQNQENLRDNDDLVESKNTNLDKYQTFLSDAEPDMMEKWLTNLAIFILRKPDAATYQTKFNPEFRNYYEAKSRESEWIYAFENKDTVYFFLIRDGRDNNGKANRGVGGKLVLNAANEIQYLEELFVTKIIDRVNLESIGQRFMQSVEAGESMDAFIDNPNNTVEWPDGRLFYSVEKSEWRYVE
jgi:hypothetical protein